MDSSSWLEEFGSFRHDLVGMAEAKLRCVVQLRKSWAWSFNYLRQGPTAALKLVFFPEGTFNIEGIM
ncbi:unnamed protein product [Linum trigynum]|uniref:Uncharacterized protein n=1 Tax=Linum trigynum TaxID=586398 RepID=A0AAV2DHI2_9ROSI